MNGNKTSAALPDIDHAMLIIKQMQDELDEYRDQLELEVTQRTAHLMKQIQLLEDCNANLCDKFEVAQKEILVLREQLAQVSRKSSAGQDGSIIQLHGANNKPQQRADLGLAGKRTSHVPPS